MKVSQEARDFAEENNIKIFTADIIYNLFDAFVLYKDECEAERKKSLGTKAMFPCVLEIVPDSVFRSHKPIVLGVEVKEGILKIGTTICVPDKANVRIGKVTSIELNGKPKQQARYADGKIAIKIEGVDSAEVGKTFETKSQLVSMINRDSIDALKQYFKDDMTKDDWRLVLKLKKLFNIM